MGYFHVKSPPGKPLPGADIPLTKAAGSQIQFINNSPESLFHRIVLWKRNSWFSLTVVIIHSVILEYHIQKILDLDLNRFQDSGIQYAYWREVDDQTHCGRMHIALFNPLRDPPHYLEPSSGAVAYQKCSLHGRQNA